MSRRFSQLFVLPVRPSPPTLSPAGDERDVPHSVDVSPTKGRKRDSVKNLASHLFSRSRNLTSSPRASPPTKETTSSISRRLTLNSSPIRRPSSRHDSGIGSEKSSLENLSAKSSLSTLPLEQYLQLTILLEKLETSLKAQDSMSHSLSKNLHSLMAVKELHIRANRRLQNDWKAGLVKEMNTVREELRAIFTKKATLMQRSLTVVRKLSASVARAERTRDGAVCIDLEGLAFALDKVKSDLMYQGALSEGIIDALTRKCWKSRWVRTTSQAVEMRRFVAFVVGRVSKLHTLSRDMEDLMVAIHRFMLRAEAV